MTPLELVQAIARRVEVGHTGRLRDLRLHEVIARCRDMCEAHGVGYEAPKPIRTDAPDSTRVASQKRIILARNITNDRSRSAALRNAGLASQRNRNARSGDAQAEPQESTKA